MINLEGSGQLFCCSVVTKMKVNGNIEGIKNSILQQLDALYDLEIEDKAFLPAELVEKMWKISSDIQREVGVYITRDAQVVEVLVGDANTINLTPLRLRRNPKRLSGVRCIHTHPNGAPFLSQIDESALKNIRFDAMVAIGQGKREGEPEVSAGILEEDEQGTLSILFLGPVPYQKIPQEDWMEEIYRADSLVGYEEGHDVDDEQEKAILVGLESESSLEELRGLAETAGAQVVHQLLQKRDKPDTATYIGKGKVGELALMIQTLGANILIVDGELTGAQIKNLEQQLGTKVVDRTGLILDIFAQRAKSKEGKLQVELAQLTYQSSRLIGEGLILSRLGGGIGTRGPGETKLEVNRRRIRDKMTELKAELRQMEQQRDLRRKSREKNKIPVVALVGYTNTGKSTLLNTMTGAEVFVEDQLFATLDATSRRVERKGASPFLLVDTVGFIRKLPHTLVQAFKSTLEEAVLADVLCIVSDASSPKAEQEHQVVCQVLEELGATEQGRIEVLNKWDQVQEPPLIYAGIPVSAKTGAGLEELLAAIEGKINGELEEITLFIPFSSYQVIGEVRQLGQITEEKHEGEGTVIKAKFRKAEKEKWLNKVGTFMVSP